MITFNKWWRGAGIGVVKSRAEWEVAIIGTGAVGSQVNWVQAVSAAAVAGVLSLLTSVAGLPECKED